MKTQFAAVAAFAGAAYASLEAYATTSAPAYGYEASTSAPASSTTYACNPAHEYPEGVVCTTVGGSLTLVTPTSSTEEPTAPAYAVTTSSVTAPAYYPVTSAASTTYACNPAHEYPEGVVCTTVGGSLTLVTPTSSTTCTDETTVPAYPVETTSSVEVPSYSKSSSVPAPVLSTSTVEVPSYSKSSSVPAPVWSTSTAPEAPPAYTKPTTAVWTTVPAVYSTSGVLTAPIPSGTPAQPYGYNNVTVPATGSVPSSTSPGVPSYTGAASKMAGGALLAVAGAAGAFFL